MVFSERRFRIENRKALSSLHPDFKIYDNGWYYNRYYKPTLDGAMTMKIRFSFDNPSCLDDCSFLAKIGVNKDSHIHQKYIGFIYGQDRDALVNWAQRFDFAELIVGLDKNGVSLPNSEVILIKR